MEETKFNFIDNKGGIHYGEKIPDLFKIPEDVHIPEEFIELLYVFFPKIPENLRNDEDFDFSDWVLKNNIKVKINAMGYIINDNPIPIFNVNSMIDELKHIGLVITGGEEGGGEEGGEEEEVGEVIGGGGEGEDFLYYQSVNDEIDKIMLNNFIPHNKKGSFTFSKLPDYSNK